MNFMDKIMTELQERENKKLILENCLSTKLTDSELNLIEKNYPLFYARPHSNINLTDTILQMISSYKEQNFDFDKVNYIEDVFGNLSSKEISIHENNFIYKDGDMYFEWDIEHSKAHQLTIDEVANAILKSEYEAIEDKRRDYGENRYRILSKYDENNYIIAYIYKYKPNVIRIITAVKISKERFNRYVKALY